MVMSPVTRGRVLVRLREVTQELTVGIGTATASVRTLTDVSLEVRERELVVLSGSRGAGERAVLAIVAGDRRGFSGSCDVIDGVRVRIMRISAEAALALAEEWQRAEVSPVLLRANALAPDVFLLDVAASSDGEARVVQPRSERRASTSSRVRETPNTAARPTEPKPWDEKNRAALRAWAEVCHMRGGAVIMAAGDAVGRGLFDSALLSARRPTNEASTIAVREVLLEESSVRIVPMHSGRLAAPVSLRTRDLRS